MLFENLDKVHTTALGVERIRKNIGLGTCAREKQVEACPLCSEYPCEQFHWLDTSSAYTMLKSDNELMRKKGLDTWKAMQESRRDNGFTYVAEREKEKT